MLKNGIPVGNRTQSKMATLKVFHVSVKWIILDAEFNFESIDISQIFSDVDEPRY